MPKLIFTLLLGLLGFSSTYASFPVTENKSSIEVVENNNTTIDSPANESPMGTWSFVLGLLWYPFIASGIIFGLVSENLGVMLAGMALSGISFIGAIITGFISLKRGESPKWKAIVGLSLTLGLLLISILGSLVTFFMEQGYY